MNYFLFLTVAIVSGFSIRSYQPKHLLKDPRALVAAISKADPEVVTKLIAFAEELIEDGEAARTLAIDNRDAADAAAATAGDELTAATSVMDAALVKKEDAQTKLAEKTELESSTRSLMDAALAVQVDKQQKFDEAQATMETELKRIESEDGDLKNVKSLLEDLMPALIQSSRSLLSVSMSEESVDPAALQNVIDLVADLLKQGEADAAHFTELRDTAQSELTAAIADHDEKEDAHTHALGAKSVATDHLAEYTEEHNLAVAAHGKATDKKDKADAHAVASEATRVSEEARIDGERADFEKVIALLETLGDKEGGAEEAAAAAEPAE